MQDRTVTSSDVGIRAIAFYLPQFHPVPENDEWWGKGFTEWNNVAKSKPLFPGHYQPHIPLDLGFYDLRLQETRNAQAKMAKDHGIYGFCYYHYWFNGRRILERPFSEIVASGEPDYPFCLCWANENWTRTWDGGDRNVLLEQHYSEVDDIKHIRSLMHIFSDKRYIRVNGKPLFLVYRSELMPDPARTAAVWRQEAINAGIGDLYLARVESFTSTVDPRSIGFDAAVGFAPDWRRLPPVKYRSFMHKNLIRVRLLSKAFKVHKILDYQLLIDRMLNLVPVDYARYDCVTPGFDNSPRRSVDAAIFTGSTPLKYELWLRSVVKKTAMRQPRDERLLFINAWNEWGEGNHLEPDLKWGKQYLIATKNALSNTLLSGRDDMYPHNVSHSAVKRLYWKICFYYREMKDLLKSVLRIHDV